MKDLLILLAHLLTTLAKLMGPGGARAVVSDSLLMKQQLLVINRSRRRAPDLPALDRFLFGFWSLFLNPRHLQRAAVIIQPSTLLKFHNLLIKRKDRLLYSAGRKRKPGVHRNISALTTIRYSSINNGRRIFASWMLMNSKAFPIRPARILSLSDSAVLCAVNILITPSFGMPGTSRENAQTSGNTITGNGSINR
jgi:hypothetical protein